MVSVYHTHGAFFGPFHHAASTWGEWLYNIVQGDVSTPVALPLPPVLVQTAKSSLAKLASGLVLFRWLGHTYRLQEVGTKFLFSHPRPISMVVSSSSKLKKVHCVPTDREGKKLDALGRYFYTIGSLGVPLTAYSGFMGRHQYYLWDQLRDIFAELPEDLKAKARQVQGEGMTLVKHQLTAARHSLDACTKAMVSAVTLRQHSWLRVSSIPHDIRVFFQGPSICWGWSVSCHNGHGFAGHGQKYQGF